MFPVEDRTSKTPRQPAEQDIRAVRPTSMLVRGSKHQQHHRRCPTSTNKQEKIQFRSTNRTIP